ncbi:hypothetical protein CB1_000740041 [Camelus ferus]|nr:hypothetical protein CB1_000740041 [Camelus ferus]
MNVVEASEVSTGDSRMAQAQLSDKKGSHPADCVFSGTVEAAKSKSSRPAKRRWDRPGGQENLAASSSQEMPTEIGQGSSCSLGQFSASMDPHVQSCTMPTQPGPEVLDSSQPQKSFSVVSRMGEARLPLHRDSPHPQEKREGCRELAGERAQGREGVQMEIWWGPGDWSPGGNFSRRIPSF